MELKVIMMEVPGTVSKIVKSQHHIPAGFAKIGAAIIFESCGVGGFFLVPFTHHLSHGEWQ